jgi:prepilin-type N-terminal cleavage/methylation domain-containing protein
MSRIRPTDWLRRRLQLKSDDGFSLIELAVSMGILSIVSVLAMTVLVSTRNISKVVAWQSSSNFELRQLVDNVFADIETARSAMGCDVDHDGRADTLTVDSQCGSKMVERPDAVLLLAGPNRLCYYSNRLQTRTSGATSANFNPPYVPVCLAVVGTNLRLEIFDPPATDTDNWNRLLNVGTVPQYRNLGTVDPTTGTNNEYFQYFKANSTADIKGTGTFQMVGNPAPPPDTGMLSDTQRADINSLQVRVRLRLTGSTADKTHTRDLAYRITMRATRYRAERCGLGNVTAGVDCS